MSNELKSTYPSGSTVYAIIRRTSDSYVWQTTSATFVTWVDGNIANYDTALTDRSGDFYSADFPSAIAAGTYAVNYYVQAGGTPAITDVLIGVESPPITWSGAIVTGSSGPNTETIGSALTILQVSARNAGIAGTFSSDPYTLTEGHLAIKRALSHFIRETHCTWRTDSVSLDEDDNELDFSAITGFHPERTMRIWSVADDADSTVRTPPLDVIDYEDILEWRQCNSGSGGAPRQIGFNTTLTAAIVDYDADQDYTVYVRWWSPLVSFTVGSTSSDTANTIINMPADMVDEVVSTAGVCYLQSNQPEQLKEGVLANLWAKYAAYVESKRGSGNMGVRVVRSVSLDELRARRLGGTSWRA